MLFCRGLVKIIYKTDGQYSACIPTSKELPRTRCSRLVEWCGTRRCDTKRAPCRCHGNESQMSFLHAVNVRTLLGSSCIPPGMSCHFAFHCY